MPSKPASFIGPGPSSPRCTRVGSPASGPRHLSWSLGVLRRRHRPLRRLDGGSRCGRPSARYTEGNRFVARFDAAATARDGYVIPRTPAPGTCRCPRARSRHHGETTANPQVNQGRYSARLMSAVRLLLGLAGYPRGEGVVVLPRSGRLSPSRCGSGSQGGRGQSLRLRWLVVPGTDSGTVGGAWPRARCGACGGRDPVAGPVARRWFRRPIHHALVVRAQLAARAHSAAKRPGRGPGPRIGALRPDPLPTDRHERDGGGSMMSRSSSVACLRAAAMG
jgi:hypothetical protein